VVANDARYRKRRRVIQFAQDEADVQPQRISVLKNYGTSLLMKASRRYFDYIRPRAEGVSSKLTGRIGDAPPYKAAFSPKISVVAPSLGLPIKSLILPVILGDLD